MTFKKSCRSIFSFQYYSKARLLRDEKGIAEYPDLFKRQKLTEETINKIKSFYFDDEFSRQLPGKKDSVSIGRNNHCAKRLLLCNLKELYATYRCTYPEDKIGFSKFASLRPKWCTLGGPKEVTQYVHVQFIKTLNWCLVLLVQRNPTIVLLKRQYAAESPKQA